jgi:Asp/Glu/hydantoin racemase
MSAIDLAARLVGVPQATIDEVENALPQMAKLLQLFKDNEDLIVQGAALAAEAQPLIAAALAFYAKIVPLINPVLAEIDAVTPAAKDVIAFLQKQQVPATTVPLADRFGAGIA